jgi:tight adherence protein C
MTALALLGAGAGLGAWLVVRALTARPVPLELLVAELGRPGVPIADDRRTGTTAGERLGRAAMRLVGPWARGRELSQRLRVVGRTAERHAVDKVVGAAGAGAATALLGAALPLLGLRLSPVVLAVAVLACGGAGFVLPDALLRDEAERRRRAFRHALSSYLDLVNVILAGGGGIETALHAAVDAGDGWAFAAIRQALDRARLTSRTPWDTFAHLGDELGVDDLKELAASVALAGSGARIRQSLAAKADSLRGHQVAETEAAAEAATERMTIPVAVLLFGFLVFVAYPAVQQITTVSSSGP